MPEVFTIHELEQGSERLFEVKNEEESRLFASNFILLLKAGDAVAFYGELGAGKTAMVRAMAEGLGYKGFVNSPTFTLLNIYEATTFELYHFDFYRIDYEEEAVDIGFEEYIQNEGICFIEWPERVHNLLPVNRYEIHLEVPDYINQPTARLIRLRRY
ncbi:MAG: tRNA (adenosine(37)-N6)-threonylcarbamoyltransferase complex ATPase subunit type 1 TsaE [Deferribacteres bacterium]|nr:tRNA (adenosine(37)-N6)-threonylcarbamoyltransferase complex ATPase subunit type 1 TsaE [candidate division KSB1 bacterium]MCB9504251.1 tRNA (adenosine(37)-N6)-threonylcarbamoyltransferase complex ATPase subunit type 1 TsaE [Deferribacteres bacterium]